jgi:hypothetical protein
MVASHHRGPGGTGVGLASPTWHALEPCLDVDSSVVLWNLPIYTLQNYPTVSFDI